MGAILEGFAVLQKTGGQRPIALARFNGALAQQHLFAPNRQAASDDLRVDVMNVVTTRAHKALSGIAFRHGQSDFSRTLTAKLHFILTSVSTLTV